MKKRTLISILFTLSVTLGILLAMGLTASAAEYDLWIRDTQVTDENKNDIRGDGVFRFISEENKLVISGDYRFDATNDSYNDSIIVNQIDGLIIDVAKESTIAAIWNGGSVLLSSGDVTIQGEEDLFLSNHHAFVETAGIFLINHLLTVDHMCLTALGSGNYQPMGGMKEPDPAPGIRGYRDNASLRIVSSYVKTDIVSGLSGGISLEGCSIVYPEDAYIQDGSIYDSSGKLAETVIIAPDPTHTVIPNALNVRKEPGTDSERIGGVTAGKEVVVLETQGEWSKIVYGTGFGWVQSKYLDPLEEATYTVTFDANGGSGSMPTMTVKEGEKLTLPECTFTPPEGKVFDRWIAGNPGEKVDVGGDSVIRAFWKDTESFELPNPFVDIFKTDDYYDAVLWAYYADPQITNGMDETHFGPGLTVTRGQAVTFLWRSMGCPEPTSYYNPFEDVPSTEYYYKPILWAVEKGITKGVDETHFNPMDTLSTLHIITFLFRTTYPGKDGWDGDAAVWAADEKGRPFGIDIAVNNETDCPRCHVVQFLYCMSK